MIQINKKADCCGCNACGDICPKQAISFETDIEGFWYPNVDMNKCIDCHLCEKVCPILQSDNLKKNDYDNPHCFAVQNKNLESLFNSTSGSAFAAFAEKIYKQGGYVGGAVFNDDYSVSLSSMPESELGLGNILNIILIVIGILLILLGIAIMIRLK